MIKSASYPLSSHPDPSLETPAPRASRVFPQVFRVHVSKGVCVLRVDVVTATLAPHGCCPALARWPSPPPLTCPPLTGTQFLFVWLSRVGSPCQAVLWIL